MTCVPRQHDSAARRMNSAETVVLSGARVKTDPAFRPALSGAPDAPWSVLRIDRPGTYRIASDVLGSEATAGILIAADHVTLDLAGFSVVGKPGSLAGIVIVGQRTNVCVRNGTVRGWGSHGVDLGSATESSVESVRATENAGDGVRIGANSDVADVHSWSNSGDGVSAGDGCAVRATHARANAGAGIRLGDAAFAEDCLVIANNHEGIIAGVASVVRRCVARHNHAAGIVVADLGVVDGCELLRNDAQGIRAGVQAAIMNNRCLAADDQEAIQTGAGSTIQGNIVPTSGRHAA